MNKLQDTVWQREGFSWIWDEETRNEVCKTADGAWSMRRFLLSVHNREWPNELPGANGRSLVVAGLDAFLDLLTPDDAEDWLGDEYKLALSEFYDRYRGIAALIFWITSNKRILLDNDDQVVWACHSGKSLSSDKSGDKSRSPETIDFGRVLWGRSNHDVRLIVSATKNVGLYTRRLS